MNHHNSPTFLFGGPTLYHLVPESLSHLPLVQKAPAEKGDIDDLIEKAEEPGEIILVDGIFDPAPPLAPDEVDRALERGWQCWGVASAGALLAAKMNVPGMRGFGVVFRQFLLDQNPTSDEIALLHSPTPPYTPSSEPLIHQRLFVQHLVPRRLISERAASCIVERIEQASLEERTLSRLSSLLVAKGGLTGELAIQAIKTLPRFRAKNNDLNRFLRFRFS